MSLRLIGSETQSFQLGRVAQRVVEAEDGECLLSRIVEPRAKREIIAKYRCVNAADGS